MGKVVSVRGQARPTVHGKRAIAVATYRKGTAFVAATVLLRQRGGDASVVLHLLCQGIEVMMKGLLLIVDYDKFRPKLKSKLHHNLVLTSQTALDVVGLPRFKGAGLQELSNLDKLYSTHLLRYGSSYDVLVDAATIPYTRTLRRVAALVRRISRKGIPNAIAIQS